MRILLTMKAVTAFAIVCRGLYSIQSNPNGTRNGFCLLNSWTCDLNVNNLMLATDGTLLFIRQQCGKFNFFVLRDTETTQRMDN